MFRGPRWWVIIVIMEEYTHLNVRVLLCCFAKAQFHTHTWADIQLQTDIHPHTQTPARLPTVLSAGMRGIDVECLIFFFLSFFQAGWEDSTAVPTCVPKWSMSAISGFYERLNLFQGIWGISAMQRLLCRSSLPLSTHKPRALFTQRHVGWTPFTHREERKQDWDTGKKSSRDMQTRACVWAQTVAEVRLFLEPPRIYLMNLHYWNSTGVSTSNRFLLLCKGTKATRCQF